MRVQHSQTGLILGRVLEGYISGDRGGGDRKNYILRHKYFRLFSVVGILSPSNSLFHGEILNTNDLVHG